MKHLNDEFNVISEFIAEMHQLNSENRKNLLEQEDPNRENLIHEIDSQLKKDLKAIEEGAEVLANEFFDRSMHLEPERLETAFQDIVSIPEKEHPKELDTPYYQLLDLSDETLSVLYDVGLFSFEEEDYEKARKIFRFLSILDSTLYRYWFALGAIEQEFEQYQEAIEAFKKAIENDPYNSAAPYLNCGVCARELNEPEMAEEFLNKTLEIAEASGEFEEEKEIALAAQQQP